jgi:nicotinamide mononucleotide (NMN) deamidase PncC
MVQNLSKISKAKINVSITGIAGPMVAQKKPVGLVYIGLKKVKILLIKIYLNQKIEFYSKSYC